ncbi:hypothetical protein SUGI_0502130 [Cryptomeria japonica]|nr:hypothetical protein SUGI_0502130 [Cryptomeria japonica]
MLLIKTSKGILAREKSDRPCCNVYLRIRFEPLTDGFLILCEGDKRPEKHLFSKLLHCRSESTKRENTKLPLERRINFGVPKLIASNCLNEEVHRHQSQL